MILSTLIRFSKFALQGLMGPALAIAFASPSAAADAGGGCCADMDSRIAELEAAYARKGNRKIELNISGVINRSILYWDDGRERNTYIVDPAADATAVKFDGSAKLGGGWKAGYTLKIEGVVAGSDTVDQGTPLGDPALVKVDRSYFTIEQEKIGKVMVGRNNSASRGVDNLNLSESEMADGEVNDWMGGFFLRARNGALLSDLRWGDFVLGKFAGAKSEFVTYVSPKFNGFEVSAAAGKDDYSDVALRYSGEWAKLLKVRAGIGYFVDTTERPPSDPAKPTENVRDRGWGGSLAFLHIPTGLNLSVNHGRMGHTDQCLERGAVSGKCRGDDQFTYLKGGIVQKLNSLGPTAFYGEHYWGRSTHNDSKTDTVDALALNPVVAPTELKGSRSKVWGFGLAQQIEDSGVQLYIGYRHHDIDFDLIDATGSVAQKGIKGLDIVFSGVKIEF